VSGVPSDEEQLRAAYEAELARVSAIDVMLQGAVSLLNVAALRMRPPPDGPPRDLEQVRDAIDGAGALLGVLEQRVPQDVRPLRDALSQLQMAYAREVQAASGSGPQGSGAPGGSDTPGGSGAPGGSDTPGGSGGAGGPRGQDDSGGAPGEGGGTPGEGSGTPGGQDEAGSSSQRRPGPAESSGRLWVPGT
jgi:hypothetical protein